MRPRQSSREDKRNYFMLKRRFTPIGIDIRQDGVYAAQYRVHKNRLIPHLMTMQRLSADQLDNERVLEALREVTAQAAGLEVVAALPRLEAETRRIQTS